MADAVDLRELLAAQRENVERLAAKLTKRQRAVLRRVAKETRSELATLPAQSWGAVQAEATLMVLQEAVRGLVIDRELVLAEDLGLVTATAQRDVAVYLATLDNHYAGVAQPLGFNSLEWWSQQNAAIGEVRLRQFQQSFRRYGADAVAGIEDALSAKMLVGKPWHEARGEVWDIVRDQVGDREWMVDRILRTEISAAYNGTTLAALMSEDEPEDPMLKKLVATWDRVTGKDSMAVHGQTRKVNEPFVDPKGRVYMAPPNRPHDRELVVGWRTSYAQDMPEFDAQTKTGVIGGPKMERVDPPRRERAPAPIQPLPPLRPSTPIPPRIVQLRAERMLLAQDLRALARSRFDDVAISRASPADRKMMEAHNAAANAKLQALRPRLRELQVELMRAEQALRQAQARASDPTRRRGGRAGR